MAMMGLLVTLLFGLVLEKRAPRQKWWSKTKHTRLDRGDVGNGEGAGCFFNMVYTVSPEKTSRNIYIPDRR